MVSRKAAAGLWPQLSRWWAARDTESARGLGDDRADDVDAEPAAAPAPTTTAP